MADSALYVCCSILGTIIGVGFRLPLLHGGQCFACLMLDLVYNNSFSVLL